MAVDLHPERPMLETDGTDELALAAFDAGMTLGEVLALGISPIKIRCTDGWKPLLEKIEERFGYCWEWVPDSDKPPAEYYLKRWGVCVLRKVG